MICEILVYINTPELLLLMGCWSRAFKTANHKEERTRWMPTPEDLKCFANKHCQCLFVDTHLALNVLWIKSNRKQILIPITVLNHVARLMRHMGCIRNGPHTPIHYSTIIVHWISELKQVSEFGNMIFWWDVGIHLVWRSQWMGIL